MERRKITLQVHSYQGIWNHIVKFDAIGKMKLNMKEQTCIPNEDYFYISCYFFNNSERQKQCFNIMLNSSRI